eukprot:1554310-Pyramimonas_sp.AAC.1
MHQTICAGSAFNALLGKSGIHWLQTYMVMTVFLGTHCALLPQSLGFWHLHSFEQPDIVL